MWLVLLAVIILIDATFVLYGCKSKVNFGIIDGIAIAIYLPIVTLIAAIFFKSNIKMVNMLGIVFIAIGAYLTNI